MKKGKSLTVLVLVLEIAFIAVLHAVKINQSEKTAAKRSTGIVPQKALKSTKNRRSLWQNIKISPKSEKPNLGWASSFILFIHTPFSGIII